MENPSRSVGRRLEACARASVANAALRSSTEARAGEGGADSSSRNLRKSSSMVWARSSSRSRAEASQRVFTTRALRCSRRPIAPSTTQPAPSARIDEREGPARRRPGHTAPARPRAEHARRIILVNGVKRMKPSARSTDRVRRISPSRTSRRTGVTGSLQLADLADAPVPALRREGERQARLRFRPVFFPVQPARPHDASPVLLRALVERAELEPQRRSTLEAAPQDQQSLVGAVISLPDSKRARREEGLEAFRERGPEWRGVTPQKRRLDRAVEASEPFVPLRLREGGSAAARRLRRGRNAEEGAQEESGRARDRRCDPAACR